MQPDGSFDLRVNREQQEEKDQERQKTKKVHKRAEHSHEAPNSKTNAVFFRSGERNFEPWADTSATRVGFVREEERLFGEVVMWR